MLKYFVSATFILGSFVTLSSAAIAADCNCSDLRQGLPGRRISSGTRVVFPDFTDRGSPERTSGSSSR